MVVPISANGASLTRKLRNIKRRLIAAPDRSDAKVATEKANVEVDVAAVVVTVGAMVCSNGRHTRSLRGARLRARCWLRFFIGFRVMIISGLL